MADYVTLLGAEDVRHAANRMASAADQMQSAASSICFALETHQRFMEDWLTRLDGVLSDRVSDLGQTMS